MSNKFKFTELRLAAAVIGQSILHDECPTWENHLAVCDAVGNAERQTSDLLAALEKLRGYCDPDGEMGTIILTALAHAKGA